MKNYLNKKVKIYEKLFSNTGSAENLMGLQYNIITATITNIYDDKFIELDNKILISINYIYKIEII